MSDRSDSGRISEKRLRALQVRRRRELSQPTCQTTCRLFVSLAVGFVASRFLGCPLSSSLQTSLHRSLTPSSSLPTPHPPWCVSLPGVDSCGLFVRCAACETQKTIPLAAGKLGAAAAGRSAEPWKRAELRQSEGSEVREGGRGMMKVMMRSVRMRKRQSDMGKVFILRLWWGGESSGNPPSDCVTFPSARASHTAVKTRPAPSSSPSSSSSPSFCLSSFFPFDSEQKSCVLFSLVGAAVDEQNKLLLLPKEWRENQNCDESGFLTARAEAHMLTGSWNVSPLPRPMPNSQRADAFESRSQCRRPDQSGFLVIVT